jgi:hypothetical protein
MFQWVLSFVEMSLTLTLKSKTKNILIRMLASDYNSSHIAEDSRIKEVQESMEVSVQVPTIEVAIWTEKAQREATMVATNGRFSLHDSAGTYIYTAEAGSLQILADQYRHLPVLKLHNAVFAQNTNKLTRKYTCIN